MHRQMHHALISDTSETTRVETPTSRQQSLNVLSRCTRHGVQAQCLHIGGSAPCSEACSNASNKGIQQPSTAGGDWQSLPAPQPTYPVIALQPELLVSIVPGHQVGTHTLAGLDSLGVRQVVGAVQEVAAGPVLLAVHKVTLARQACRDEGGSVPAA